MEDKYPIKEIKIMDGVYIWKPESKTENNSQKYNNDNKQELDNNNNSNLNGKKTLIGENNYLCHGIDDLIKIYEIEFEEIGNKILSLFQSNEEMLEFDPHDYDLIQAREENLQLIDKKIEEMTKIQEKMKGICGYHPIVNVYIFDYFKIEKKKKEENININNDIEHNSRDNINSINDLEENKDNNSNIEQSPNENSIENKNEIITEIEL